MTLSVADVNVSHDMPVLSVNPSGWTWAV